MTAQIDFWPQEDGEPITCQEQIKILEENWEELEQVLRDAFDDAALMGVSRDFFKKRLMTLLQDLYEREDDQ